MQEPPMRFLAGSLHTIHQRCARRHLSLRLRSALHGRLGFLPFLLSLPLLLMHPAGSDADGPHLVLAKLASPTSVSVGGEVRYAITLSNSGNAAVEGLVVEDTLPAGFAYRSGTSSVVVNGVTVSIADPTISGSSLTWSGLALPSARIDSLYGIHTFVQRRTDSGYIDYQLDRSVELMGSGAYVTQLFDWIDPAWHGPQNWMRDFVARAYDRWLTPVIRLAGGRGENWYKPKPDADGSYTTWAQTFRRVVEGLPRRDGHWLYIQIWNEPNLNEEWEGQANPAEYGRFLVDTFNAIQSIGDPRILVLNAPLSPGAAGDIGINCLEFLDAMLDVPGAANAFHVWASHPYPNNHPPEYNIHDGTAAYPHATIDAYQRELEVLANHGRGGVKVLLTETGYALYHADFVFEGYPAVNESNRADYVQRAFRDYWSQWPEVIGVCPYELVDPEGHWWVWDWLWNDGRSHQQYDIVRAMDKSLPTANSILQITFDTTAALHAGTFHNDVSASAVNVPTQYLSHAAPVSVYVPTPTRTPSPPCTPTWTSTSTSTLAPTPTSTVTATTTQTAPVETVSPTPSSTALPTSTATLTPSPTATSSPTSTPTLSATVPPTPACVDLIVNGGFEGSEAWELPETDHRAGYSTTQAHSGQRSMRLGIESALNVYSYSDAWQEIHIPADAHDPLLAFWYYPVSDDTEGDRQYAFIQSQQGEILEWFLVLHSDARDWTYRELALDDYRDTTIRIRFSVRNDGLNGVTSMYVDDASVLVCGLTPAPTGSPTASATASATPVSTLTPTRTGTPSSTATATATTTGTAARSPTPSQTATPTHTSPPTSSPTATTHRTPVCADLVVDGGFEWDDDAWDLPQTAHPASYTRTRSHSGQRSMRLGIESAENVYSYSTARQTIHVPADSEHLILSFWYYPASADTENDLQYVLLQDAEGDSDWVFRIRSNAAAWTHWEHPLPDRFKGKSITMYFGVLNDGAGGTTAMYVDDVALPICSGEPTPLPTGSTPSAHTFLPLILRGFGPWQGVREAARGQTAIQATSLPEVRTLWRPSTDDVTPDLLQGLTLNPASHLLYVASGKSIWVVDPETGRARMRIPLDAAPRALAVDVARNLIYAALWEADALAVIDGSTHTVWKIIEGIPGASGVAVCRDRVYVTATRSNELFVVNGDNYAIMWRIPVGEAPYAVACDSGRQRAFVGNAGGSTVSIVDGLKGRQVAIAAVGGMGHPHGLAYDPVRDRLYVTYALSPKHRAIAALDASSGQTLSRLMGSDQRSLFAANGIAVDPLAGWVYAASVDRVWVLAAESLHILQSIPGAGPAYAFGLHVDPADGRLYLTDAGRGRLATLSR